MGPGRGCGERVSPRSPQGLPVFSAGSNVPRRVALGLSTEKPCSHPPFPESQSPRRGFVDPARWKRQARRQTSELDSGEGRPRS